MKKKKRNLPVYNSWDGMLLSADDIRDILLNFDKQPRGKTICL